MVSRGSVLALPEVASRVASQMCWGQFVRGDGMLLPHPSSYITVMELQCEAGAHCIF